MNEEKQADFKTWIEEQGLDAGKIQALIEEYIFTQKLPTRRALIAALSEQPSVLKRTQLGGQLLEHFVLYSQRFFEE